MIDIEMINEEIEKLENCNCTSYNICEKLAILYTVRDHYGKSTMSNAPSMNMRTTAPMMSATP